jgi:hypothetical protein
VPVLNAFILPHTFEYSSTVLYAMAGEQAANEELILHMRLLELVVSSR